MGRRSVLNFESRDYDRSKINCKICNCDLSLEHDISILPKFKNIDDLLNNKYMDYSGYCKKCADECIAYKAKKQAKFVTIGIVIAVILFLFLSTR